MRRDVALAGPVAGQNDVARAAHELPPTVTYVEALADAACGSTLHAVATVAVGYFKQRTRAA